MQKTLTCIECPRGCQITVDFENGVVNSVVGNTCPRGKEYATNECLHPMRVVTSTVCSDKGIMIPVKTNGSILKEHIFDVMEKIKTFRVKLPVAAHDVVYKNVADGIDLIATKTVK